MIDQRLLDCLNRQYEDSAMDVSHAMMIFGSVLAHKPETILELGVGTGFVTDLLLMSIEYNVKGQLTCLDSWSDVGGVEPALWEGFRERGAQLIVGVERGFCYSCPSDSFDFLVSDADHSGDWFDQHCRICLPGATMFFHDTNTPKEWPSLARIVHQVKRLGWSHHHFTNNSRRGEHCDRGLLMVVNGK